MTKNEQELINLIATHKFIVDILDDETQDKYNYWVENDFDLGTYVLELIGYPKDTTVEFGIEHGFCQDYYYDILCDRNLKPKETLDKLIRELPFALADYDAIKTIYGNDITRDRGVTDHVNDLGRVDK